VPGEKRWLVVGHGSVGSFVARRLVAHGERVVIFDPHPRVVPVDGEVVELSEVVDAVDYAVSCVTPDAAQGVPSLLKGVLRSDGVLFDWNSVSPATKRAIAEQVEATTVDVALLDTLDADRAAPRLAVSGLDVERSARLLRDQDFDVAVVGEEIGDAAAAKYLRSMFMKALEALVLEYEALGSVLDGGRVVRDSIGANLGAQFLDFMDVLVETDRVHARRRADEVESVARTFSDDGWTLRFANAAAEVLGSAADAWDHDDAPPLGATAEELAQHLGRQWWRAGRST
jgi:hypothetical protein